MTARFLVAALLLLTPLSAADKSPSWLREFATTEVPEYDSDVPAVVLFREQRLSVDPAGRVQRTERRAVKILTREGRREALARAVPQRYREGRTARSMAHPGRRQRTKLRQEGSGRRGSR